MEKVTKKKVVKYVQQIFPIIEKYYGISPHHSTPPYIYLDTKVEGELKGEYCCMINEITVYRKNINGLEELIRTLVHEYQHYLQSPSWMTRYYKMGHTYESHPYELKAFKEEENWDKLWEQAS